MVGDIKQGDIIKLGLNPVLVVSNKNFNSRTNLILVCPISSVINGFPMHVQLEETTTIGEIKCEQIKAIDPAARPYIFIESAPKQILLEVIDIIYGSVEFLD